jgi:hypothetical protein
VRDGVIVRGLLSAALAAGCAHGSGTVHDSENVERECAINLTGSWELEGDVGYRYEATDDGQTLRLVAHRVNADGTALAEDAAAASVQMELRRSLGQFSGDFRMPVTVGPDESCAVLFHTKLTSCASNRLILGVEQTYALNPGCQPLDIGAIASDEHVLVRVK